MSGLLSMSLDAIMADKRKSQPKPKPQARPQQQRQQQQQRPSRGGPVRAQSNRRDNRATPYQRQSSSGGFGGGVVRGADAPGKWQQRGNLGGGNQFGGRNQQQQSLSSTKVMVGNLVKDVRVGDILELFQDIGEVKSAELHYTPGGQPKGSAEVTFVNPSHAKTAIETYNKRVLDGRPMRVFLAPASTKPDIDSSDLRNRLGNNKPSSGGVNFAVTLDGSGAIFNKERRTGGGGGGGMLRDEFRERRGGNAGGGGGGDRTCFGCGKPGHIKQDCPQGGRGIVPRPSGMGKVIGAGGKNSCFECGGMGHIAVNCPNHKYKNGGGGAAAVPRGGGGGFRNKNADGGGFGRGGGGGGGGFKKKEEPSQDDLDKEMDSYMSARK